MKYIMYASGGLIKSLDLIGFFFNIIMVINSYIYTII